MPLSAVLITSRLILDLIRRNTKYFFVFSIIFAYATLRSSLSVNKDSQTTQLAAIEESAFVTAHESISVRKKLQFFTGN